MKIKTLVVIADGTEDIEVAVPVDLLRRAGLDVIIASDNQTVVLANGIRILPDKVLRHIEKDDEFNAIILPGGGKGVKNLWISTHLKEILLAHHRKGRLIGAICAAPLILAKFGILDHNTEITSHPTVKDVLSVYNYSEESVVVSRNIVTSRGAGTSFEFGFKLVELLTDSATARKIAQEILYTENL
ncbi:MAG: metal dependent phosphohydrolase [Ignavibacteria bacterium]|nr:metal dependent phosphohydrolase [Ignavibacteria bacterium]